MKTLNELQRFRSFKVETLQATNTKSNRVKITDLRFGESVVINYGASQETLSDLIIDFFTSKGITLVAQSWAESSESIHLYGLYFTTDFTKRIKVTPMKMEWSESDFDHVQRAIRKHFAGKTFHTHKGR